MIVRQFQAQEKVVVAPLRRTCDPFLRAERVTDRGRDGAGRPDGRRRASVRGGDHRLHRRASGGDARAPSRSARRGGAVPALVHLQPRPRARRERRRRVA
eukprot:3201123-Prymnesium_polylepis.1